MTDTTPTRPPDGITWMHTSAPVAYPAAVAFMERRAAAIADGLANELVWTLEHPPLYTAGTSARSTDLVDPDRFPVHPTGRGGQFTYHGPGQRVAYVMLNLKERGGDVRAFVHRLEAWLIATLARCGVTGCVRDGRVGVWVERTSADGTTREDKIAALGIRVRRGVTMHGISLNIDPDLSHFSGIVPCGITDHGVTSLADLGIRMPASEVDLHLHESFQHIFGPVRLIGTPTDAA